MARIERTFSLDYKPVCPVARHCSKGDVCLVGTQKIDWEHIEGTEGVVLSSLSHEVAYYSVEMAAKFRPVVNKKHFDECPVEMTTRNIKQESRIVKEDWEE